MREITVSELSKWSSDSYHLLDMRSQVVYNHGNIPGSHRIDAEQIVEYAKTLTPALPIVLYCQRGEESKAIVSRLEKCGLEGYSLQGGYLQWLIFHTKEVDMERYSRHLLLDEIGYEGQKKLLHAKVLVVGAGGLGAPAALYLAAAGVGTIGIVDNDVVDLSNLQRQILHNTERVGQPKVDSARQTLNSLNPDVQVILHETRLTHENAEDIIKDYDFIIDGVDNFETKFLINDCCVLLKKPFCHGGILRFQGQLMTYVPDQGPCYRCVFGEIPDSGSIPTCREAGVLGVMAGIIGCLQALESIKYIVGMGELLTGKMLVFDGLRMSFRKVSLPVDSQSCRVCGPHADIVNIKENRTEYTPKERICELS